MTKTLKEKLGNLWNASLVLAGAKFIDTISTSLCVYNGYGIDSEQNPNIRWLMHQFGVNNGLLMHAAIALPVIIGGGYLLNKSLDYFDKKILNSDGNNSMAALLREQGTLGVYYFSAMMIHSSIHNIHNFMLLQK